MLSINTNLSSLIAQRSLNNSTLLLNQAIERMTTGYKINHAKDNAANYAIATDMTTKIGAYQVAEDNTAMGMDLVRTADDTLSVISSNLNRLRALAEQAANGTYGKQSINAINTEAKAIIEEMYRIKNNAEYNGQKLFGKSPIDEGNVGASGLEVNEQGFLQDVVKRDTSSMIKMESVNETTKLAKGTYSISTADELAKLARMQNAGRITAGSEFVLAADIDLSDYASGEGWVPIGGNNSYGNDINRFSSTLDGNGYKISNLVINSTKPCRGLIGVGKNATIKNLGIESGNISTTNGNIGPLVGLNYEKINVSNCYAKVNVTADIGNSGGLIGYANADGVGTSNVEYCYATGEVKNHVNAGGLIGAGTNGLMVTNCFATGNITTDINGGGVIGGGSASVDNCFATGNIICTGNTAGGIIGNLGDGSGGNRKITNSHYTGNIIGAEETGGIFGNIGWNYNSLLVENCYVVGNVEGTEKVGGLIGWLDCGSGVINNCHFVGKVSGQSNTGSLVGSDEVSTQTFKNCTYSGGEPAGFGNAVLENVQDASLNISLQVGINADENSQIQLNSLFVLGGLKDIFTLGLQSNKALSIIDNYIARASEIQTNLGSIENRLESALEEISAHYENLSSSRSTLKDADIAEVSSEYIRQQILQQASATLLATANQSPSLALQLI